MAKREAPIDVITLEDTDECAQKLLGAAKTLGFVYITLKGTDISPEQVSEMFSISKDFFALPQEEKASCAITANNKGWSGMLSETLDPEKQTRGDFKEAMNFGEFTAAGEPQQPVPLTFTPHVPALANFANLCASLSRRLLRLFAIALAIDPAAGGSEYFTSSHTSTTGPSGSILRLLHYPACPLNYDHASDIRAGAHSDYGSITLLFQNANETGLEVLSGGWQPVPIVKDAICVNIGDLLSYWTGGLLKSTVHRVVVPKEADGSLKKDERYSIAYFCHPVDTTPLEPIPSEMVKARGERGANDKDRAVMTASQHLESRLAATYGWKK